MRCSRQKLVSLVLSDRSALLQSFNQLGTRCRPPLLPSLLRPCRRGLQESLGELPVVASPFRARLSVSELSFPQSDTDIGRRRSQARSNRRIQTESLEIRGWSCVSFRASSSRIRLLAYAAETDEPPVFIAARIKLSMSCLRLNDVRASTPPSRCESHRPPPCSARREGSTSLGWTRSPSVSHRRRGIVVDVRMCALPRTSSCLTCRADRPRCYIQSYGTGQRAARAA